MDNVTKYNILMQCEAIIQEGLDDMYKIDRALCVIDDLGLYGENYKDFEAYCQAKWSADDDFRHVYIKNNNINRSKNEQRN